MIRFVGDVDALTGAVLVGKRPRMSSKRTGMVDSALTRRLMVNVLRLYTPTKAVRAKYCSHSGAILRNMEVLYGCKSSEPWSTMTGPKYDRSLD